MTISPFDSALLGPLFSDEEISAIFNDSSRISSLLLVEAALALAEGAAGVIPAQSAEKIAQFCSCFRPDPADLASGTASAGVPVPALVKKIKAGIDEEDAKYVHFGATSQDIVDTAMILRVRDAMAIIRHRLRHLVRVLVVLAREHRQTVMIARTRSQQAVPTTFGLKVAGWIMPLVRIERRLHRLAPELFVISLGGAAGTLASLGDQAFEVESNFAEELDLGIPEMPWHSQRDSMVSFASLICALSGALGKMGQDLVLLAQSEIAEILPGKGGGSSTMPHKSNPVQAEMLVTLARFNAGQLGSFAQTQIHEHERSGMAWLLEWLCLPQMIVATGAALVQACEMVPTLKVEKQNMERNLGLSRGAILAEAATFALADHLGRDRAEKLIKQGMALAHANDSDLFDELPKLTEVVLDWAALRNPANYIGQADGYVTRVMDAAEKMLADGI